MDSRLMEKRQLFERFGLARSEMCCRRKISPRSVENELT